MALGERIRKLFKWKYFLWTMGPILALNVLVNLLAASSPYQYLKFKELQIQPSLPFVDVLAPNDALVSSTKLGEGKFDGPESITFDANGNIYGSTADGNIMVWFAANKSVEVYARVGGRPLGIQFDKDNNLIVCDALKGLVSVHPVTRQVTILVAEVDGEPLKFTDALAISQSGKIYFTESCSIAPIQSGNKWDPLTPFVIAHLTGDPKGRLLEYDPESRYTRVLVDGLLFANGVALSKDEDYVLVADSANPSIRRYYLTGPKAGQSDIFVENLPGIPDGLTTRKDGSFYVAFFGKRSAIIEQIHPHPEVKQLLAALHPLFNLYPAPTGFVGVLDPNGTMIETLWDEQGKTAFAITDVKERRGKLYMGSLFASYVAVHDLRKTNN